MAQITVGGKEYIIPEMNFVAIERAWPFIVEATETLDPMRGPGAALAVFAAAIMEGDDFDKTQFDIGEDVHGESIIHNQLTRWFKKKLKGKELNKIKEAMFEVLAEAGLDVTPGEAEAALIAALGVTKESPSMETAPDTSQSSLPLESKEDPGTP